MKTPSEIHAEIGKKFHRYSTLSFDSTGHRAFTVSDIAKIIEDAKAESDTYLRQAASDNADWFDALVNDCAEKLGCEHKPTAVLSAIKKLKAESKGVCEWSLTEYGVFYQSSCSELGNGGFKIDNSNYNFCPGCGKEIKVV